MFGKKRESGEACTSCDRTIDPGQKICACGKATRHMDFSERTRHEVEQWRAYRQGAAAS